MVQEMEDSGAKIPTVCHLGRVIVELDQARFPSFKKEHANAARLSVLNVLSVLITIIMMMLLLLIEMPLLLVAFLLLVVRPGAPSSVLARNALCS